MNHPRDVLLGSQAGGVFLPVCDHYSGVEALMRKSLLLQAEMTAEFGACVFDVTLDCEDGAPVGGESDHAQLVTALALEAQAGARVAVRVHPVDHPAFEADVATIVGRAGHQPCHPRDKNIVVAGAGRRHAHQQAGGGDDAVIGAQHGGAQPANAIGTVAFGVSAGHGIPPAKR